MVPGWLVWLVNVAFVPARQVCCCCTARGWHAAEAPLTLACQTARHTASQTASQTATVGGTLGG